MKTEVKGAKDTKVVKSSKDMPVKKITAEKLETLVKEAKVKGKKEIALDEATTLTVAKKVTNKKDLKYLYPADCDTLAKRKSFRTSCRKKLATLEKNLKLITKGKREGKAEDAEKAIATFKKENYLS